MFIHTLMRFLGFLVLVLLFVIPMIRSGDGEKVLAMRGNRVGYVHGHIEYAILYRDRREIWYGEPRYSTRIFELDGRLMSEDYPVGSPRVPGIPIMTPTTESERKLWSYYFSSND